MDAKLVAVGGFFLVWIAALAFAAVAVGERALRMESPDAKTQHRSVVCADNGEPIAHTLRADEAAALARLPRSTPIDGPIIHQTEALKVVEVNTGRDPLEALAALYEQHTGLVAGDQAFGLKAEFEAEPVGETGKLVLYNANGIYISLIGQARPDGSQTLSVVETPIDAHPALGEQMISCDGECLIFVGLERGSDLAVTGIGGSAALLPGHTAPFFTCEAIGATFFEDSDFVEMLQLGIGVDPTDNYGLGAALLIYADRQLAVCRLSALPWEDGPVNVDNVVLFFEER
jgi:hypothetical protein